jgi:hypothetical protein
MVFSRRQFITNKQSSGGSVTSVPGAAPAARLRAPRRAPRLHGGPAVTLSHGDGSRLVWNSLRFLKDSMSALEGWDGIWVKYHVKGVLLILGIFASLLMYGYAQEKIMTQGWGEKNVKFNHSVFLVMCNRITSMSIASLIMLFRGESFAPSAPLRSYLAISVSNMLATTCQYEALLYVSFPTQTLGKTAKMIPVMLWGTLLSRKMYSLKDYSIAFGVTFGCSLFLLTGDVSASSSDRTTSIMGIITMVALNSKDGAFPKLQSIPNEQV